MCHIPTFSPWERGLYVSHSLPYTMGERAVCATFLPTTMGERLYVLHASYPPWERGLYVLHDYISTMGEKAVCAACP